MKLLKIGVINSHMHCFIIFNIIQKMSSKYDIKNCLSIYSKFRLYLAILLKQKGFHNIFNLLSKKLVKIKVSFSRMSYFCKFCGASYTSVSSLCAGSCTKSDNKKHQPYEGDESKKYQCKFCGASYTSISSLCAGNCTKSDNKSHQPL